MSKPKFTPRPWRITKGNQSFYFVFGKDGCVVADFQHCTTSEEEQEFNAHLIEAAPDMYDALETACSIMQDGLVCMKTCKGCPIGKSLRKARGGESEVSE